MDSFNASTANKQPATGGITIEPFDGVVTATFSDVIVGSTKEALLLREEDHDPVFYFPVKDIYFEFLRKSPTVSHCPHKGDASHWSVTANGEAVDDVMWAYETPKGGVSSIAGHAAFYPKKVRIEAVDNKTDQSVAL
ncbi:DUF427 domain-containing protein [Tianweitania sp. BSSL-BM11]|uniref:DUF427 domain-containing protein n=1 Tax=Tianweitania aestuarii TaxID=2814886 RepID=A0ABS5RRX7_9HYPH|nr:DUF427 domain-containing protein [Tianweitania aestuarii]MBS9719808.1 DUF427 domain-containing protein [Tianweitania aestuarii]